ncbi:MAG: cysteine hydrolase [Actinomycetia bacterium]|nr:cysteine hydrolase [Actinomycetes bacterium]
MTVLDSTVPYPWPYDGVLDPGRLALVVAGAQAGWAARSRRAADVATVLLSVAAEIRAAGALVVVVRHGAPPGRRRSIVPPLPGDDDWRLTFNPRPSDVVVDATGVDGFHGGPLDDVLRARGVDHLVLGGFGHEAAVDSTLRSANDRGYECLVLTDGVAPFDDDLGAHALSSVTMSGGIFGALGTSTALVQAIHRRIPLEAVS